MSPLADVPASRLHVHDARVSASAATAGLLVAAQVLGKALRDTLFLQTFGVARLPMGMIANAAVSTLVVVLVSRTALSRSPRSVLRVTLSVGTILFLAAWPLAMHSPRAAAALTYAHAGALSAAALSLLWAIVSESFDPHAMRRAVPRIMAGATFGGVVGGLVTWRAASLVATEHLLPLAALLDLLALASVWRLHGERVGARPPRTSSFRRLVRETPYLRTVALFVLLAAATQTLLDFLLSASAVLVLGSGPPLLSFFALFQSSVGVLAFLLQLGAGRHTLERFGVGAALAVGPVVLLSGAAAAPLLAPLALAVILRGTDGVLGASIQRSAYEVLFAPLDSAKRLASKPILDVGFDRLGMFVGSGIVAALVAMMPNRARLACVVGVAALAAARLALSPRLQEGYRRLLADNLRRGELDLSHAVLDRHTIGLLSNAVDERTRVALLSRIAELENSGRSGASSGASSGAMSLAAFDLPMPGTLQSHDDDPFDPAAGATTLAPASSDDHVLSLLAELRSGHPERVMAALERRDLEPLVAPQVLTLLADDHLARSAADWITAQVPAPVGLLADMLLTEGVAATARRRVARLLGKVDDARSVEVLLYALGVVGSEVRVGVAQALARLATSRHVPREPVLEAIIRSSRDDPSPKAVIETFHLLSAAYPAEPVAHAMRALDQDPQSRGTALEWLDVLLPREVKAAIWPRIGRATDGGPKGRRAAADLREAMVSRVGDAPIESDDPD